MSVIRFVEKWFIQHLDSMWISEEGTYLKISIQSLSNENTKQNMDFERALRCQNEHYFIPITGTIMMDGL